MCQVPWPLASVVKPSPSAIRNHHHGGSRCHFKKNSEIQDFICRICVWSHSRLQQIHFCHQFQAHQACASLNSHGRNGAPSTACSRRRAPKGGVVEREDQMNRYCKFCRNCHMRFVVGLNLYTKNSTFGLQLKYWITHWLNMWINNIFCSGEKWIPTNNSKIQDDPRTGPQGLRIFQV